MYGHRNFLIGCYANWTERLQCKYWRQHLQSDRLRVSYYSVAPSVFCTWFGLLQIQLRCKPLERDLTKEEIKHFKPYCNYDAKKENFGIFKDRVVCLDYPEKL